ncbi:MAG: cbb3-type cytochrome c oxidase subunit II [Acidobacteria bacterium]|nr:cbb3-type cytochrome c oxidase subunit II [Acidobacteriota bacterium]
MSRDAARGPMALRGGVAVFAAYVAFLIFAQFGFLEQARADLAARGPGAVQGVMAAMGLAGLAASLLAGRLLSRSEPAGVIRAGLTALAATAAGSLACHGPVTLSLAAAAIGASLGVVTVAIAASLPALAGAGRAGRVAGTGTGLAYLLCNVPALFESVPAARALAASAVALLAAELLPRRLPAPVEAVPPPAPRRDLARAVISFGALVLLDSAAFAVIQAQPALKTLTWGGAEQKLLLGATHLVAAIAAGWLLDAGLFASLLAGTTVLFALALPMLAHGEPLAGLAAGPLYAIGISLYSTALVTYPARAGSGARPAPRWRAAAVYGLGGWLGSALGVGAAQQLGTIPAWLVGAAAAAAVLPWLIPSPAGWRRLARHGGVTACVAAIGVAGQWVIWMMQPPDPALALPEAAPARGREVYIAEGCIHCHSQFVRPTGRDVALWGPARALDRGARPVLVGNRRQGPDLLEVGNRRGTQWEELHLRDPRSVAPGSRMPSYPHLFAGAGTRGADLVAYLDSLGQDTIAARAAAVRAEPPPRPALPPSAERGRVLFAAWCASCHGAGGRGDGPLAAAIRIPALDLGKGSFFLLKDRPVGEPMADALARVVRHGFAPTPMPGHETLPDQDVADLVAYVMAVARAPEP